MKNLAGCFAIFMTLAPTALAERVIFDVDLTRGSAGPGVIAGGVWDKGWRTTGATNERIVFDAGRPITNGFLEASFTVNRLPWDDEGKKIHVAGLHEDAGLSQNTHRGDLFFARTGNRSYKFFNVKAAGRAFDRTEFEPRVGSTNDWITDDKTVMKIGFEWRDGVPIFHDTKGKLTVFPRDAVGGDTPVDRLRYAFLGSDNYTGLTVPGLRFTRVKLVEYDAPVDAPPPPALRVRENGRGLMNADGRAVFLLADTAWSMVIRANREDITQYLQHRRAQRFNAVTFALYAPGNADITASSTNAYGHAPYALAKTKPDPTQPLLTPGSDPAKAMEYDYWDHVDFAIAEAKRLGLYVIVLPCWGSAVAGAFEGTPTDDIIFDTKNARTYGRWLGERYRLEPHVLWMLGGDRRAYYEKIGTDYRPVFRAMAEGLREGAGPAALMSYHSAKQSPQSGDWFHPETWLAFNSIQHWPEDQPAAIARDWNATPAKPTWIFEPRYEAYFKRNYQPEQWGEWQCRQQAWQTVFAGAFGHTYGHERVFSFGHDGWDWKKQLDAPGARSMTHLAKFMNSLKHNSASRLQPDQSLLAGDEGKADRLTSTRLVATRTGNGGLALFYSANGRELRVKLEQLAKGPMHGFWFNPRAGRWHVNGAETIEMKPWTEEIASGPSASERTFDPPGDSGEGQDWVLVLSQNPALY